MRSAWWHCPHKLNIIQDAKQHVLSPAPLYSWYLIKSHTYADHKVYNNSKERNKEVDRGPWNERAM
jgi:hypothetical protein